MAAQTAALAEKFDLPYYRSYGRYYMGWAKTQGLTLSEGLALMEEAFPRIVSEQHTSFLAPPWLRRGSMLAVWRLSRS